MTKTFDIYDCSEIRGRTDCESNKERGCVWDERHGCYLHVRMDHDDEAVDASVITRDCLRRLRRGTARTTRPWPLWLLRTAHLAGNATRAGDHRGTAPVPLPPRWFDAQAREANGLLRRSFESSLRPLTRTQLGQLHEQRARACDERPDHAICQERAPVNDVLVPWLAERVKKLVGKPRERQDAGRSASSRQHP